jgi:hypothetical protein
LDIIIQYVVSRDPATTDNRSYELKQLKLTSQQNNNMGCDKQKWVTFTYYSPLFRKVTNVFQDSSLPIAFKPTNTVSHLTKKGDNAHSELRRENGVYKLTCHTCGLAYIGQTGRYLNYWYEEHCRFVNNNRKCAYTVHNLTNMSMDPRLQ